MVLDAASSRSKSPVISDKASSYPFFAICVRNEGYEPTLRLGKSYRVVRPRKHDPPYFLRVVDEEGEDYLYDRDWFIPIDLTTGAKRRLSEALSMAGAE